MREQRVVKVCDIIIWLSYYTMSYNHFQKNVFDRYVSDWNKSKCWMLQQPYRTKFELFIHRHRVDNDHNIILILTFFNIRLFQHFPPKPIRFIEIVVAVYGVHYVSFIPYLSILLTTFSFILLSFYVVFVFCLTWKFLRKFLTHYCNVETIFLDTCNFRW